MRRRRYKKVFRDRRSAQLAIEMGLEGMSYSQIATYFECDHSSVVALFKRNGIKKPAWVKGVESPPPPPMMNASKRTSTLTKLYFQEWEALYNKGYSLEMISNRYDFSKQVIYYCLKEHGVDMKKGRKNRIRESDVDFDGEILNRGKDYREYLKIYNEKVKRERSLRDADRNTRQGQHKQSPQQDALGRKGEDSKGVPYFSITF